MPVLNFKAQFAPLVERGEKRQTIRRMRKHPIKAGDRLSLFTGMRTKACRHLRTNICTDAARIFIRHTRVKRAGVYVVLWDVALNQQEIYELAIKDGFLKPDGTADLASFIAFFVPNPGDTFTGQLIRW